MTCEDARAHLLDYQRGQLGPERHAEVLAHLDTCGACAREAAAERALTEVLERRLPQHAAPVALKRRLAAEWPAAPATRPSWWSRWGRFSVPAAAVALVLLAVIPVYYQRVSDGPAGMVTEAVNDHLRILSSQNPLDVRSGGIHQVKPWFEGRLDFAPVVPFAGDQEFQLQGGAIGYFRDRKAAVFVFQRRLHVVSLFVFRAEGFPWPIRRLEPMGGARAYVTTARGFSVILWRAGELGYALVSDVERPELTQLGVKLATGS
jgi:anti-sigma factor (TIGR02949 family)